ncbi:MAG: LbtU family siderophore porin [Gammaproteobacteria bacterium]|nr:MAG: LbtU family siderophore porin [Gammaproteobacteria bacterium]UTW42267.1 LbtU family siderophore porin [bacterium SCSIO 12844]
MFKRSVVSVSTAITTAIIGQTSFAQTQENQSTQMVEVSAADLQALKAQITALTKKVDKLEANQQHQASEVVITEQGLSTQSNHGKPHVHTVTHTSTDKSTNEEDSTRPQPLFRGEHVYIESDAEYDDTLLEQLSSSQMPLGTLKLQERFHQPSLVLGGSIEADVQGWWGDQTSAQNASGKTVTYGNGASASITTANLDLLANVNEWVQGYITLAGTENGVGIDNAFINFGNLSQFPFFASVGKNRPPLGSFGGGGVWASSIGTMLFRPTKLTNVTVGYNHDGLTTYLAGWRNNSSHNSDDATSTMNEYNFVYSAFYTANITKKLAYSVNGGYMNNIIGSGAGADGIKSLDGGQSTDRNPVLNFEGSLTYDDYGLYAGIASTLFKRDYSDHERAGTWYVQGVYSPDLYGIPTTFALSYNGAYHTQNFTGIVNGDAINEIEITGPKQEVIAYVQSEVLTNVYLTLEYAWLQTYNNGKGNTITGDATIYF